MTWPPKEMFAISRIGQAYDVYCWSKCLTVKPRRCTTDKLKRPQSFHWPWRTFLWEFLPYHLFYLFTLEGFVRTRLLISMTKGSLFPLMRWIVGQLRSPMNAERTLKVKHGWIARFWSIFVDLFGLQSFLHLYFHYSLHLLIDSVLECLIVTENNFNP